MAPAAAPEIMVVDDDPQVREALTDFLGDEGFRVRDAVNGADALVQLASLQQRPALLILDLAMPVMDGYEFLQQLEADPDGPPLPIVILSANIDRDGLPARIVQLRKPIDSQALVCAIRGILGPVYPM